MTLPAPASPRRRLLALAAAALAAFALLAAACARPPAPEGWAAPRPVQLDGQGIVLVTHKGHMYALPGTSAATLSSNAAWQFPPRDKSTYPVSDEAQQSLSSGVDALDSVDDAAKANLKKMVADLTVSGPSAKALKDAVSASSAPSNQKSSLNSQIDTVTKFESDALNNLRAFYGDIGISEDRQTGFAASFRGILFALDLSDGHTRWVRDTGDGIIGGVAVDGGALYFGTKGKRVFALDEATAARKWQFDTKGEVWATPTITDGTVYITSLDGSLYALDESGKQKWVFSGAASGIAARPVVSGGSVFVGSFDNKLYSVSASDGTMNWSVTAGNWFWATPVVQDGVVYAASLDGKVYAVDAATGASRWDRPFDTGAPVRSGPVIAGNSLVVAARNGQVYKLDLGSGQVIAGPVSAGTKVLADLANDGGAAVYVSPSSANLVVLDEDLGVGGVPLPQ